VQIAQQTEEFINDTVTVLTSVVIVVLKAQPLSTISPVCCKHSELQEVCVVITLTGCHVILSIYSLAS